MKSCLFITLFLCLFGCSESYHVTVEADGEKIITGPCDLKTLVLEPDVREWYDMYYNEYQADTEALGEIDSLSRNVSFVVFLGTWCGDSKREIPRFLKILEGAHIDDSRISLYGLDRSKKSDDGMTDKYNILRVPTMIIMKGEEEVGRIVEQPRETLEKDLVKILNKQ